MALDENMERQSRAHKGSKEGPVYWFDTLGGLCIDCDYCKQPCLSWSDEKRGTYKVVCQTCGKEWVKLGRKHPWVLVQDTLKPVPKSRLDLLLMEA